MIALDKFLEPIEIAGKPLDENTRHTAWMMVQISPI